MKQRQGNDSPAAVFALHYATTPRTDCTRQTETALRE